MGLQKGVIASPSIVWPRFQIGVTIPMPEIRPSHQSLLMGSTYLKVKNSWFMEPITISHIIPSAMVRNIYKAAL
jgi:hypothetical protein